MAHGITNVSRSNPCKICGKTDWCGRIPVPEGELHICMRSTTANDIISDVDGQTYIYIKTTDQSNMVFISEEQKQRQHVNFKSKNAKYHSITPKQLIYEDSVEVLPNQKLDIIYRDLLDLLVLEEHHRNAMLNDKWSNSLIEQSLLRSFPEDDYYRYHNPNYVSKNLWRKAIAKKLVDKYGDLTGVPGAFKAKGTWTFNGLGGMIFPVYDMNGYIYRLRVRIDRQYYNSKGDSISAEQYEQLKDIESGCRALGKYHNFSSYREDPQKAKQGIIANLLDCGCAASSNISFYYNPKTDDPYVAYITEGEKKCIIGNNLLKAPFINIPGVSCYSKLLLKDEYGKIPLDYLKEKGVKVIVVAYDADKSYNDKVLKCQNEVVRILVEYGFILAVADWNVHDGKGLDDLLLNGGRPLFEFV